jgi:hypothetical protein
MELLQIVAEAEAVPLAMVALKLEQMVVLVAVEQVAQGRSMFLKITKVVHHLTLLTQRFGVDFQVLQILAAAEVEAERAVVAHLEPALEAQELLLFDI